MADLEELAGRVEGLTGPDREVDALIWCALNGVRYVGHYHISVGPGPTQVEYREPPHNGRKVTGPKGRPHAPAYTASIDAAMTLISELSPTKIVNEAMRRLADKFALHMRLWPADENYAEWLARFVTAAALRARTQGNQND